tara:strand:- start:128 stop:553 length:426 start_codon:yes stop_codon:yes gene_type:complete
MFKKYFLKMFKSTDNQTLITGANAVGLVSLLAYTLRTFNEVNSNIDELRSELDVLRKSHSENNKRSNIAFSHLNNKLEENTRILSSTMSNNQPRKPLKRSKVETFKEMVREASSEEEMEEISTGLNSHDEIRGALSELMSN